LSQQIFNNYQELTCVFLQQEWGSSARLMLQQ